MALCGLASALYIGAQFGRGPRDGLMTGLARRTGLSLRLVRTALEVAVVVHRACCSAACSASARSSTRWLIGPLTQLMLPWFTVDLPVSSTRRQRASQWAATRVGDSTEW